jgi:1,5-anhydro-D-fructose reductase (1,5-anhydro-D-mannitol-forming)
MSDRVRMAFIGLGSRSGKLADAAKRSNRIEIAGCLAAFTDKYGGVAKKAYEEVMMDDGIDAVVLTTPNSFHAPMTIEAFQHGKHVFDEKPMALSVGDCKKMIEAAKEAGLILAVNHMNRGLASVRRTRELIDTGAIGQVVLIEASHSNPLGLRLTPQDWQWYQKETPSGPLCSLTVHHADTFNYLVGPIKRVTAFVSKVCGKAETDDVISAAVEFESGALGYLGGAYITPLRKTIQVNGTEGTAVVEFPSGSVYFQKKGTQKLVRQEGLPDADTQNRDVLFEELDEFASCIREGGRPETAGEEGLAAWAVMEAIIRSAKSGLPVEIKDVL